MKTYHCKHCDESKGIREQIREHVRESHPEWKDSYTRTDNLERDPLSAHYESRKLKITRGGQEDG